MYDDLFKKYGKVVYKSNDQKSPTAEVDDDAECLACKPFIIYLLLNILKNWIFRFLTANLNIIFYITFALV